VYIQYTGFKVATNSRIYNFRVLDPTREQRAFTVKIQSDTNHWASLKLQDGPGICFERVEQELGRETPASDAELNLHISDLDIRDYMKRHYPPVKTFVPKNLPDPSAEHLTPPSLASTARVGQVLPEFGRDSVKEQVTAILLHKAGATADLLKMALESQSIQVRSMATVQATLPLLQAPSPPYLVFTEAVLPDGTWADIVKQARTARKPLKVIVVSRVVNVGLYVETMEGGAFDFIVPPLSANELTHVVKCAVETVRRLRQARLVTV
jgi:ActR/RegA family two-component response regulator